VVRKFSVLTPKANPAALRKFDKSASAQPSSACRKPTFNATRHRGRVSLLPRKLDNRAHPRIHIMVAEGSPQSGKLRLAGAMSRRHPLRLVLVMEHSGDALDLSIGLLHLVHSAFQKVPTRAFKSRAERAHM